MQVCNIQGNSFQSVRTAQNFNPTPVQNKMIKTITSKFVNDSVIYRKGKNFHDFLESKGLHILLSNGDYNDEIKVAIAKKRSIYSMSSLEDCESFPESRLVNVVEQAKEKWKEHTINNIILTALGLAVISYIMVTSLVRR